jgi:ABC-type transport system involved in cytochrome bd biosynthesis fused ATPase/permease subunit
MSDPVLKDISLNILPGEKVALCGRTGRFAHLGKQDSGLLNNNADV